jgi:hypothetical protein
MIAGTITEKSRRPITVNMNQTIVMLFRIIIISKYSLISIFNTNK